MRAHDELKRELHDRWATQVARIKDANKDLSSRLVDEPLVFELDIDDDSLMVTIGPRPKFVYTQAVGSMRLDMGNDDRIVAITVEGFSDYVDKHQYSALQDLANALKHFNRIEVSRGDRSQEVERELRDLVPA